METKDYRSAGGKARAEKLTPEQRKDIAKKAAESRWSTEKITHEGEICLADIKIPCYVTSNGVRVLSGRGMQEALRLVDEDTPRNGQKPGSRMDRFLGTKSLKELIFKDKSPDHFDPIKCLYNGKSINGYRAEVLADICEAMLDARDLGMTDTPRKQIIAKQCELLVRGFARIGITALVDEATGYQEVRDRHALHAILDKYLRKEFAAWAKRFPDEFYKQMFRLKGWVYPTEANSKPGIVGTYTNNIVYERLAPGLLEELETLNPKMDSGSRKSKHHQWLTTDVGHPALAQHLHAIIGFMRVSQSWEQFINMIDIAFPRKGHTIPLAFE